jgi:glycerol transport system substrate-binding protein
MSAFIIFGKLLGVLTILLFGAASVSADIEAAKKWIDKEFQPSTLSREEQLKEMQWFIDAAKPFKNLDIKVVSETIATHQYESKTLAKAFTEITGIKITHELTEEGHVVNKILNQYKGAVLYDGYINDSDLIGQHYRYGKVISLTDFMKKDGKDVTNPMLDLKDFMGKSFCTGPDGNLYQLPDQQFANLYWFRYDWFNRPDLKKKFKEKYGYELGVPVNWSAYEDIANFFTNDVKEIDGKKVYGHMDYGKRHFSLGWRFSDAWFSMAGMGSKGLPNGLPVDEWGIRVEGCSPVGASVARGGQTNSPAAIYGLQKFIDWLNNYAPKEAREMDFSTAGSVPAKGNIAQQIFWYTAFTADMIKPGAPVVNADGTPKWRMAPSPKGAYWTKGMKLGYQDCGSWTYFKNVPLERTKAAWLYGQFCTSKTVSLKKFLVGLTPIRISDINSKHLDKLAPKYGGLIEFYRSPARISWTPTGTNVPDYAGMAPYWWQELGTATYAQRKTAKEALDSLAEKFDSHMEKLQKSGELNKCNIKMNPKKDEKYWIGKPDGPKPKLADEKPKGETVPYEQLLKHWREGRAE